MPIFLRVCPAILVRACRPSWLRLLLFACGLAYSGMAFATQYGSPVKVLPFTLPCCVAEMAILDLNGDGFDDVLAASLYYPIQNAAIPLQILLNDGRGGFFDGTSQVIIGQVPTTVDPRRIVIADFNG